MLCPHCQQPNPNSAKFCRNCGQAMNGDGSQRSTGGRKTLLLVVGALALAGLAAMFMRSPRYERPPGSAAVVRPLPNSAKTRVGIAYGTEKQQWLEWAAGEFAKSPAGANIQIDLKPMGSLEAANAIVRDDASINVWAPASALYRQVFLRDWSTRHGQDDPILKETPLALSPMVLVMWQERFDAFSKTYPEVTFKSLATAMHEKAGWAAIAKKPEWMFFKFSHTNPNQSNSGLIALMLMAYDYGDKAQNLTGADITRPEFQSWLLSIERTLIGAASGLVNSTGNLMTSMLQRGPSTYDCVLVYESNAIERLKQADARWGPIRVVYPKYNYMNDNPYYVLNVPWSTPDQRAAAQTFGNFLLTKEVQARALADGFRPASAAVSITDPDSPWTQFAANGLQPKPDCTFCESPSAEVIENLLISWQRSQAGK